MFSAALPACYLVELMVEASRCFVHPPLDFFFPFRGWHCRRKAAIRKVYSGRNGFVNPRLLCAHIRLTDAEEDEEEEEEDEEEHKEKAQGEQEEEEKGEVEGDEDEGDKDGVDKGRGGEKEGKGKGKGKGRGGEGSALEPRRRVWPGAGLASQSEILRQSLQRVRGKTAALERLLRGINGLVGEGRGRERERGGGGAGRDDGGLLQHVATRQLTRLRTNSALACVLLLWKYSKKEHLCCAVHDGTFVPSPRPTCVVGVGLPVSHGIHTLALFYCAPPPSSSFVGVGDSSWRVFDTFVQISRPSQSLNSRPSRRLSCHACRFEAPRYKVQPALLSLPLVLSQDAVSLCLFDVCTFPPHCFCPLCSWMTSRGQLVGVVSSEFWHRPSEHRQRRQLLGL